MAVWHVSQTYQLAMIILCCFFLAIVGTQRENAITKNLLVTGFLILLQNIGYLIVLSARDLEEALIGVRVEYLGTAFIVSFMMMFVLQYCKRELKRWVVVVLMVFDGIVLMSVWCCRYTTIYYSSLKFEAEPLPHLVHGNGPLYIMTVIMIAIQMLYGIFTCFITWKKSKPGKMKMCCGFMTVVLMFPLFSYGISMTGLLKGGAYDSTPGSAAMTSFLLGLIILFGRIFDGQAIAYATIIRKLKEPVVLVDNKYRFVECNDRAYEVFPSLVGLQEGDEIADPMLLYTLQNERISDIISDDFIMRPDVQQILEHGEIKGYAVLLADLTEERRQLEESQQLKLEAEIANKAKSDFLAQMSHEIRTPINAVLGMNEMILRESREENVKKYAIDIKDSASSLLSIINEILDLTKIESGRMELIPANYALSSVLNDLYNMMNIRAKQKNLALIFDIQKDIPSEYFGDDIRLRQILINLLTNAIKYTQTGNVTFSIRGGAKGTVAYLRFSVTDTGVGIRPEDIEKLFEKYRRFDESKHREIEGTGLGMNITMRLLRLMGSDLKVNSTYGKGSCFYFDLHQRITNREPLGDFSDRVARQKRDYQWETSFEAPQAHVLVVDDNNVNRKVFMNLLKQTKMQIDEAGGGREALGMIADTHYDLIFLDHMMPEMDGIETLHEMEKMDLHASDNENTPVIMLTANAVVGAEEKYMQEGFSGFLTKPIMPEKLEAIICKYLPQELLIWSSGKQSAPAVSDEPRIALQPLDEFDWDAAMRILQDESVLVETLQDFVEFLPQTRDELSLYMDTIDADETLKNYRICVHSLKSSAATVGAILLSKLARLLEEAAAEGNMERLHMLHPVLMEEIDRHHDRLCTLFPENEDAVIKSDAECWTYLAMLRGNLEQHELSASDMIIHELVKYSKGTPLENDMGELKKQVDMLEFEEAVSVTDRIMQQMKGDAE
ncbi:MAG: ATP-binding protein [Lachnospiraceae bacterium]